MIMNHSRNRSMPTVPDMTAQQVLVRTLGKRNLKEARNHKSYASIMWGITSVLFFFFIVLHIKTLYTDHTHSEENSAPVSKDVKGVIQDIEEKMYETIFPHQPFIMDGCLDYLPDPDNRKHIVPPPPGPVTIVCCNTTKGVLNIEVHPSWAPLGAERFLYMVKDNFFSSNVPLFRAMRGFLVQFGLAGDPEIQKRYFRMGHLQDDPNWLPEGPSGRERNGTQRFQKGYLAYAGAGKNSRGTQLIMAFENNRFLGGGSPWEVPFGQIFGSKSFETMSQIYTGYGEKPSQGKIMNRGDAYTKEEFPLLDYINYCVVVKEDVPYNNVMLSSP